MSRVWFLADTHFGYKNDNEMWLSDFNGYFNDVLIPLMKKEYKEGDILVHLGDVYDNRSTVGLNTICDTINIFNELSGIFNDIRIIVGNHDIYNKSSNDITSIRIIERIPNIKVYDKPVVEEIDGKKILFHPWVNNIEDERELLASVNVDYIFGHLDVNGCSLNEKGSRSMSANSVDSKDFKESLVYAGHIHKKQDYKKVHYVGSPYQMKRGEIGDSCGITVLDLKTGKTLFYENTYSARFKDYSIYEILDKTVGDLKTEWKNKFVTLNVKRSDSTFCRFDKLIDELSGIYKEFNTHSVDDDTIVDNMNGETDCCERKSTDEYVKDWFKDNDISGKRLERMMEMYNKYKERI